MDQHLGVMWLNINSGQKTHTHTKSLVRHTCQLCLYPHVALLEIYIVCMFTCDTDVTRQADNTPEVLWFKVKSV